MDEIVLGLSAAKEQQQEPKKSISGVTTNLVSNNTSGSTSTGTSMNANISVSLTVTKATPSPSPRPQSTSSAKNQESHIASYLAQAEQHNLLLKQQQQLQQQLLQQQQAIKMSQPSSAAAAQVQRKTYEAMIADISKVADFSAKINSYSHEAKVSK